MQRGSETGTGQRLGQDACLGRHISGGGQLCAVGLDHCLGTTPGEVRDRGRADRLGQILQCLHSQLVVGVRQPGASDIGEQVRAGRTSTASLTQRRCFPGGDGTFFDELIEVPTDGDR